MRVLIDADRIRDRVDEIAGQVNRSYKGKPVTAVGVLTGSLVFLADLIRRLEMPLEIGLVQASSYRGQTTTPGELELNLGMLPQLAGRNVLLLDDILDTGQTLGRLLARLRAEQPATLKSAVLLKKRGRLQIQVEPDFVGFTIPDEFVVGYGLDYDGRYRNLPHIAALDPPDYS